MSLAFAPRVPAIVAVTFESMVSGPETSFSVTAMFGLSALMRPDVPVVAAMHSITAMPS